MSAETIGALLREQAAHGDKDFVVVDADRLTYAGAEARSRKVAAALIAAGAGRGSRVAMLMGNSSDFAVTFLGITRIGAVALPFSTMSTPHELAGLLANSDSEYLVSATGYRGRDFREVLTGVLGQEPDGRLMIPEVPALRRVWFGAGALEGMDAPDGPVAVAEAQTAPADTMVLVHTSGSTSAPKGVIHTHGQVIRNMRRQNATRGYTADEVLFANAPWFWVGGLAYSFLATLIAGARLLCSSARPAETLDLLEAEKPTMTNGVASTMLALAGDPSFASRDLSSMRRGNLYPIMPPEVRPKDPELRHNLLGMTEAGSVCIVGDTEDDLPERMRGSYGKPVEGVDIRIVDPETGKDGPEGELWLRGPNVMQGYYGRERHDTFDEQGWYHSGDMFTIDAEGYCYFKGRTGDIIRTNGAQVSPREVEGVLSDVSGGRTAIVVGVPDEARGQAVTAVMVGAEPVDSAALTAALRERLSPYKVPRRFVTMTDAELPTLSSGKIDLRKLVEIVSDR